ncbi:glycosyltransferase family 2 protein [Vibrio scophthalmi]|uniref:Glycosyltransferase 2-like domain-containing protein n=1 Tax=Vibrio scophthalmi TaxID=45658 RepID=A0A1B1NQ18_9VIBR|nr:glycosyltransferase [Vibrio scophthalmi]ANS85796.1 hypothetical protein VSVS12_02034 [Vibrio scophthalmi]ANU36066.1 hypothetical protein VSVS05_00935 [Vibrio scophthalmi]
MLKKIITRIENRFSSDGKIKEFILIDKYQSSCLDSTTSLVDPNSTANVVLSLTTYTTRIDHVFLTIESLGNQTVKPNKIVLWLDENEFNEESLPGTLKKQREKGLEIRYTANTGSYKKLFPAIEAFSDTHIITVDDDILYPYDLVERLLNHHTKQPLAIIGCRAHKIVRNTDTTPKPYTEWLNEVDKADNNDAFLTSGGGTLFPHTIDRKAFLNKDLALKLCPNADDIWINYLAKASNIEINKMPLNTAYRNKFHFLSGDTPELKHINVLGGKNERCLSDMQKEFGFHL